MGESRDPDAGERQEGRPDRQKIARRRVVRMKLLQELDPDEPRDGPDDEKPESAVPEGGEASRHAAANSRIESLPEKR